VNGDDALYAGVHVLPLLGATAFGSFLAGAISSRRNNTSWTLIGSSCCQLLGVGLFTTLSEIDMNDNAQYGYQVLLGLGIGLSLGAATILASVQSHKQDLAVAHGAIAQARVLGGAVGIAICSIILNAHIESKLPGKVGEEYLMPLYHSPAIGQMPLEYQPLVRDVYRSAFSSDTWVLLGVSAANVAVSLLTIERHPPPMPSAAQRQTNKDAMDSAGRSEIELDGLVRTSH
jgi:hypothetical protein